ncbi:dTDP-4-amino-4,6-dideoxygalactose transaminase [Lachnospiraceae bacterium XBB2008]|nr:dTDP-4-amino-4,6-dideoxygalactose transaminase [Lachnospiraceae bacterium XBB2008]
MINVTRPSMPDFEEYVKEISGIWENHWLTNMGPKHDEFAAKLKEYLNVDHVELMVNGHMAIEMTLQALNLQGEVITTPFTFASTTHAIVRNSLTPVFCDINSDDYTIDVSKIENLITDRTCAILPVHVYGNICDVEGIDRIAKRHGLKVVYDACHAFGETYKGVGVGNFGDASCFSFHATKVFNTIEGGAVVFKSARIGEELYSLKNFGIRGETEVTGVGANAKMNELCAAMGICNLRHNSEEVAKRKIIAKRYRERLSEISGIYLNCEQENVEYNYGYFPIRIDFKEFGESREEIHDRLLQNGIRARRYFYPLTNTFECFHKRYDVSETPVALHMSKQILTLPIYADLELEDVDRIIDIILSK